MRQLAEQMMRQQQQNGDRDQARLPENFRTVTPRDLQNMLDRIETIRDWGEIDGADPSAAALTGRIEARFACSTGR